MVSARHWAAIDDVRLRIMSEMQLSDTDKAFLVAFAGATRRAGATTVAVGVARAFQEAAMEGDTLLVGLSSEGKSASAIARAEGGATSAATGGVDKDGAASSKTKSKPDPSEVLAKHVQRSKAGFDVVTVSEPAELRRLFKDDNPFWSAVSEKYKVVCIDAGTAASEGHVLIAPKADLSLLVVDGKRISRRELTRLGERLEDAHLKPDGVILNRRKEYLPRFFRAAVE